MALGGTKRSPSLSGSCPASALPEGHSSRTMRMPVQNEPKAIHGVPCSSTATTGSMALWSLCGVLA